MATGDTLAKRLARIIDRYGQTILVKHGLSTDSVKARVQTLSTATRNSLFRADETTSWELPAYSVTFPGDYTLSVGGPDIGDLVEINGEDFPVRRIERPVLGDAVVKTVLHVAKEVE